MEMEYRRLGRSGLKVSVLSFGSWVTFANKDQIAQAAEAAECLSAAKDAGVNFFDNAEGYAAGESERVMGEAFRQLGWKRHEYVVSTKLFWGLHDGVVNMKNTLNRKYLNQAIDGSLERFGLDFVDLVFCHRPDQNTPLEETVWAMSDMVSSGKALYWGTSEWSAYEIRAAWDIADKHHLHKPVMEQPQYNLFERHKMELDYISIFNNIGMGTTIWSPLASGLLTGKYNNGVPEGSRLALENYGWLKDRMMHEDKINKVRKLDKVAKELNTSLATLSIAWCIHNPHVTTAILGATKEKQLTENLGALDVYKKLTPGIMSEIESIMATKPVYIPNTAM